MRLARKGLGELWENLLQLQNVKVAQTRLLRILLLPLGEGVVLHLARAEADAGGHGRGRGREQRESRRL